MRTLSDGEKQLWNEMQQDAAPSDYYELSSGMHRAKKKQKCSHNHIIMPGEYYEYQTYIADGEFVYYKTCKKCNHDTQDIIEGRS